MKVLTFNTALLDVSDIKTQMNKILKHLAEVDADIVMLQEMPYVHIDYFNSCMQKQGYYTSDNSLERVKQKPCGYDVIIFAKNRIEGAFGYTPFDDSLMGRGVAYFKCDTGLFITSHLESTQTKPTIANRMKQLKQLYALIESFDRVVVGMDANHKYNLNLPQGVTDVWQSNPQPTWHGDRYFNFVCNLRYDRVLIKGVQLQSAKIDTFEEISDHDALIIELS
jgi:endonuclease/exonuclease/phosphatase family metal-dependent hydrolase